VYVGSWYGFVMVGAWDHPVKPNVIPRQIPRQEWYAKSVQAVLLAGLIPFAVIFIELLFMFKSVWQEKSGYYYVFGFLAVVCGILVITVIEVSVVATYVQLCSEVCFSPTVLRLLLPQERLTLARVELPLVVAILPCRRRLQHMDLPVLHLVLHV
jgi:hypothetical protein